MKICQLPGHRDGCAVRHPAPAAVHRARSRARPLAPAPLVFALFALTLLSVPAGALPHFSRKYETGCQTCHLGTPRLNSFGLAFRDNGFEWPGGEEDVTREPPIVLSADANREAFPNTTWPSWMPRSLPLSVLLTSELDLARTNESLLSPAGLGSEVELILGGAIASGIAARADLTFEGDVLTGKTELDVEQAVLQFRLYRRYLDLRIGKLYPELFSFAPQSLGPRPWIWSRTLGDTGFRVVGRRGLELRSIFGGGRVRAVLGTAGSEGNFGRAFDLWGRLGVKIGGMPLTGIDSRSRELGPADPSRPWRDNSVQLSAFGYYGNTRYDAPLPDGAPPGSTAPLKIDDRFFHAGADLTLWLWDLNLLAAFVLGRHDALTAASGPTWIYQAYVELDYIVFPWLVPSLRFEYSSDADVLARPAEVQPLRLMAGSSFLIRDHIRTYLYLTCGPTTEKDFDFNGLLIGAFVAF